MRLRFWLRWAARDLRQRWQQVLAIAAIIALGTGMYAGLGGQETWRVASLDASYGALCMYDLRLTLTPGSRLGEDEVRPAFAAVSGVRTVEPRLVLDTQVEVVGREHEVRVTARVHGVDTDAGGPQSGHVPEHFLVMPPGSIFVVVAGEASFGVVTLPLAAAQEHDGRPGQVNEVPFELGPRADPVAVAADSEAAAAAAFPGVGVRITLQADDPVHNLLYTDAVENQVMLDFFAWILLAGAALAAFSLAGRVVESQRREIGIGMALGVPRAWIALRPLLMGLQMAAIGTMMGLAAGYRFARCVHRRSTPSTVT